MKRFTWLLVAVILLGLAAFFMSRGDKPKRTRREAEVDFPRHPRSEERLRNERRRTLPPARPKNDDSPELLVKRDPLIVALPTDKKKSTVVFEVAGLRDSPIGKAWLDCLMKRDGQRGLDKIEGEFGLNPVEDIERVAVSSAPLVILSVHPDKLHLDRTDFSKRTFGSQGAIYQLPPPSKEVFATWGDSLVLTGPDVKAVEEAITRLESGEATEPAIPEWSQYGDIYGSISPQELADMMPEAQEGLAAKVREAVDRVDLHVDASEDVAIVADVEGPGANDITDLGKSFGAALSIARVKAQSEDNDKLAELLDYAAVHPHGNRFALDVALPFDVLKEMGPCRKRDESRTDAGRDDDP